MIEDFTSPTSGSPLKGATQPPNLSQVGVALFDRAEVLGEPDPMTPIDAAQRLSASAIRTSVFAVTPVYGGQGGSSSKQTSGWACGLGGSPFRFQKPSDLSRNMLWVTNLEETHIARMGRDRHPHFRAQDFLGTHLDLLRLEWGLTQPFCDMPQITQGVASYLGRILSASVSEGVPWSLILSAPSLGAAFKDAIIGRDASTSAYVDEGLQRAYQARVVVRPESLSALKDTSRHLWRLRRPRWMHARQMLMSPVPKSVGDSWSFLSGGEVLGATQADRIRFLAALDAPYLAKIEIKKFHALPLNDMERLLRSAFEAAPSMSATQGLSSSRKSSPEQPPLRAWVTQPELLYLSQLAVIDVAGLFVAERYGPIAANGKDLMPTNRGPLSNLGVTSGLVASNIWQGLAAPSPGGSRGSWLVTPRACWISAADRYVCLTAAMILSSVGFEVVSYGHGAVDVSIEPHDLARLSENAFRAGLMMPAILSGERLETSFFRPMAA